LGISLFNPVLDYSNLLALTGFLTHSSDYVEEMSRSIVFNYLMDNKDDHCKNFSYMVTQDASGRWRWHLAPAYDLTLCTEGYNGEHATSVNGSGHPRKSDFISVGTKIKMSEARCRQILEEIIQTCGEEVRYEIKD
ncbi:MAG: HipA domain-containing protein, partial [Duncaniella sp.]|nr:HipA domain-containing protein [Duncaniella sp.]